MSMSHSGDATSTGPVGFLPVSGEERYRRVNPDSRVAHAAAARTVILQVVSEAFDLYDEEEMWLGYHLDNVLAPLLDVLPHTVPLAMRQEMLDGTYSRQLELRGRAKLLRGQAKYDSGVLNATVADWVEALLGPIFMSYRLRPLVEDSIRGQLAGLLRELGVGNAKNPRGALFLPNDLRMQLNNPEK